MRIPPSLLLCIVLTGTMPAAQADDGPRKAFLDHIAYVATFTVPLVIESCGASDPGYLQRAAPLYFRYVNARQDAIERGRLLTLAELEPSQTLQAYREQVLATRLRALRSGTADEQRGLCAGVLGMLEGKVPSGTWP